MKSRILNAKTLDELNFEIKFEMLDFFQVRINAKFKQFEYI